MKIDAVRRSRLTGDRVTSVMPPPVSASAEPVYAPGAADLVALPTKSDEPNQ